MSDTEKDTGAAVAENVIVDIISDIEKTVDESETTDEILVNIADKAETELNEVISDTASLIEEKVEEVKDEVLDELKEKIREIGVKKSTLAIIIKFTMEAVEKTPLKGSEQKDYALRLIRALVVDLASGDEKDFLLTAIDSGSVGDTIDLIVQATQGKLEINTVVEVATTSCLPCCLSLLSKRKKKQNK